MLVACGLITVAGKHTRLTTGLNFGTRGTRHRERIVHNGVEFAHCATGTAHFAEGMDDIDSFPDDYIQRYG
jgi:6-phosphogluconate dehydrogenase (decarboxylating)